MCLAAYTHETYTPRLRHRTAAADNGNGNGDVDGLTFVRITACACRRADDVRRLFMLLHCCTHTHTVHSTQHTQFRYLCCAALRSRAATSMYHIVVLLHTRVARAMCCRYPFRILRQRTAQHNDGDTQHQHTHTQTHIAHSANVGVRVASEWRSTSMTSTYRRIDAQPQTR